ncbi:MAG: hypothetical protein ACOX2O_04570 [Bdellovibrionota bacterium]|jgi:hypothetical protein
MFNITNLFQDFSLELFFWICAIIGTLIFSIRLFMTISGLGGDDLISEGVDDIDADSGLNLISLTTVVAFIMMFGWVGIASLKADNVGAGFSILFATVAGLLTMVLIAYLFKWIFSLTEQGDVFQPSDALGKTAEVFEKISAGGKGMVFLNMQGHRREFTATSEDGEEIPSFTKVVIQKIVDQSSVVVKKL